MTIDQALAKLKSFGSEQTRKTYKRHGVGDNMFGVSYSSLGKMQKKIKVDQALAQQLWATGNHDARILAMMVADPKQVTEAHLDEWATTLDNYGIAGAFARFVSSTAYAEKKIEKWTKAKQEWIATAGWDLLAFVATKDPSLHDDYFAGYLSTIERTIHRSANRVRYSMNGALIAIGIRNRKLQKLALTAAKKIGVVQVDHGETGCKTPDAAEYIRKTVERGRKPMQVASRA